MDYAPEKFKVKYVVQEFNRGILVPNLEYQRGSDWDDHQMKSLIDSLFRRYPLPPIFLHEKQSPGLRGEISSKFEIVDGQQRILSLVRFRANDLTLFEVKDKHLKIPNSLRDITVPWEGKTYSSLSSELQEIFNDYPIDAYCIKGNVSDDEVRDLFIRLQSGKPLNPQQVRDAWPGPIGPFVEQLAGKLKTRPPLTLFEKIDRRGNKEEESKDKRVNHRVICAQLLLLFIERSRHPDNYCAISSKNIDQLYHENTNFDPKSEAAQLFYELLKKTEKIVETLEERSGKSKFRRLDIIGLFCFLHDLSYLKHIRVDTKSMENIAQLVDELSGKATGKSTSLAAVQAAARALRERAQKEPDLMTHLDANRVFNDQQKREIHTRQEGNCAVCKKMVHDDDSEYDHFPVAYARGGRTEVSNGRLVHRRCHPRFGRIPDE